MSSSTGTPALSGERLYDERITTMSPRTRLLTGVGALLALVAVLLPTTALAHYSQVVGKYTFRVGFLNEPSIQGQPNGLDLTITDANSNPVDGAEKTLKVGIAYGGGAPKDLPLTARFGLHGQYTAYVIPTKAGSYSFVFSGTLNGDAVSVTFESGPDRFDDVVSAATVEFPPAAPAAVDQAQPTQAANDATQAAIQRATLIGLGGVAVGLIGMVLAAVALISRARPATDPNDIESAPSQSVGRG